MSSAVRVSVITILLAIAIAQAWYGIARAQPQAPVNHCRIVRTCKTITVTPYCPPPKYQSTACQPPVPKQVCDSIKVCTGD